MKTDICAFRDHYTQFVRFLPASRSMNGKAQLKTLPLKTSIVFCCEKPGATKRKAKQQSEAAKEKVPHDVRQRYVTQFTEAFLDTSADIDEAFKKVDPVSRLEC